MTAQKMSRIADTVGGVPCVRGLRMPVATVVGMVGDGMTIDEI